jgi:putative copper resistance protein D
LDDPLIFMRAIHFAATISVAGVVCLLAFVGEPAFRGADKNGPIPAVVRSRLATTAWMSLAVAVLTGAAWLIVQAEKMSDLTLAAVFLEGMIWTVLSGTDFGSTWIMRLALTILLAATLYRFFSRDGPELCGVGAVTVFLAGGLVGSLAFAGHAAAGSDIPSAAAPQRRRHRARKRQMWPPVSRLLREPYRR